ncbi:MAG: hypothetical protein NTY45_05510 [Elusimicrobia bacterium]|nr:hypothetical protein [Elusimicrobiota bacterium]
MNMDAKTDQLINKAIAALPYRRPRAGFALRVMAEIAAAQAAEPWKEYILKATGLTVAGWTMMLGFFGAKLVYSNLPEIAAFLIQPGAAAQGVKLLAAHAALFGVKLAGGLSFMADLAAAAAGFPGGYEIAAAAVICAATVAALSKKHAHGRI